MAFNYLSDVEIIIGEHKFSSDNYTVTFSVQRFSSRSDNSAIVTIDYLTKETRDTILELSKLDSLKAGQKSVLVSIMAGYKTTGKGLIFYGTIDGAETTNKDGIKLTLNEGTKELSYEELNKTFKETSLKEIVKNIMSLSSFGVGVINCDDYTYTRGKTYSCSIKEALEDLAKAVNADVKVIKNVIHFVRKDYEELETEISADTGLKFVRKKDYYYIAEMYFNNVMQENMKLKIIRDNGEVINTKIMTVSHMYSKNKFETIVECEEIEETAGGQNE